MCFKYNIKPILCIGESADERISGNYFNVIEQQLKETVMLLSDSDLINIMVAYEPVWAIGTGETASSEQISELHSHIRKIFTNRLGAIKANHIPILYGGSCNSSNTSSILNQKNVDGLLVEMHPNPKVAKSDANQQLDFEQFAEMKKTIEPIAKAVGKTII